MRSRLGSCVIGHVLIAACCVGAAGGLRAEEPIAPEPPVDLRADITYPDVYINDSFEAADAIADARAFAVRREWMEAAELLQQISDKAGDKLVRIAPGSYVGLREHVNRIIAGWPAAGVAAYRSLYEPELQVALSAGRVSRTVHELLPWFDRYFCTESAAGLAEEIGQLAIESGDLAVAEHVYRRVIEHHPDASTYALRYEAMLAVIAAMRGDPAIDRTQAAPSVKVRWMGQDRPVRDVIGEIRERFAAIRSSASLDEWPTFGGGPDRAQRASSDIDQLGLLWRFTGFASAELKTERYDEGLYTGNHRDRARSLTIQPIISGGLVIAQRFREIVALHRNTGAVAWWFRADVAGAVGFGYLEEPVPGWASVTVHDGRVYASLPGDTVPYYSYESAGSPPELACLDAGTGRVIWRVDQRAIEEEFAETTFDTSPIVLFGRLYVVGRRRRSFGFEDCYLHRFNAATGTLEHRTHLGSSSTGSFGSPPPTMTVAAMHGDTVYVCTNLGTIAAVSGHTGAVRWLRMYERQETDPAQGSTRFNSNVKPWQLNPVIWSDGRIICLPTDAEHVLVLSADDGSLLRSIHVENVGGLETLLGVEGDILCGMGREAACYDLSADALLWSTSLLEGTSVYGRGVWTDNRLLIPSEEHISTFRVADGQRSEGAWEAEGEGGNLIAFPNQMLVAGVSRISAYVRKSEIWESLRGRMEAAPSDPLPALELAEVALSNGEFAEAVAVLDEAVRRAELRSEPLSETLGRRLFDDVLMFLERLSGRSILDTALLDRLFTHASQYAPDASAHLTYRFRFAEPFERAGRADRAVGVYRQVIRDRSLRELPADPNLVHSESAGVRAQARIAALVAKYGREVYAPHEAEARRWLESGRAAGDEQILKRVVETFPNSKAAPLALIARGELLLRRARPAEAAGEFARAYHRYARQVDRPTILRKIADAYELAGRDEHAYRWCTKAAREHPSVRFDQQGRLVTFLEYRERLAHVRDRVEPSRPHVVLPLSGRFTRDFEENVSLLTPWFGDEPASRWSRCFVRTPAGIRALDPRSGESLWPEPVPTRANVQLLIARSDVAVFATSYDVYALDAVTGERRWSHGDYPPNLDDQLGDWEDAEAFRSHALEGDRLLSVRDSGRMACVAVDTGERLWSQTHRPEPIGRVRLTETWVVYHVLQDGRTVVCLLDTKTGAWSGAIMTDERRAVEGLFVTLDGRIILATSQSISSFDPETHARHWRVAADGHIRRTSLLVDVDALYFSDDGHRLKKISLENGALLWESERLVPRGDDDLTVGLQGGSVIVSSAASVSGVDAVTGLTLWRGTTPERPRFATRLITRSYVIAVDVPGGFLDAPSVAYFYDHRNASGVIPREGGAPKLGALTDVRATLAADGALLIQAGSTIMGWTSE